MEDLKRGVTADGRISTWGSYVSNGAGGSCFGKDIRSLIYQLRRASQPHGLLEAVYEINEHQKSYLLDRAVNEAGFTFNQKKVALLGLAFKKHTNDMRDSSALNVVEGLLGRGVEEIRAYDPLANEEARRWFDPRRNHLFDRIVYCDSASDALAGTAAAFITTDWEEFRALGDVIETTVRPPYLVIDGRRMIADSARLAAKGYSYLAVGGKLISGRTRGEVGAERAVVEAARGPKTPAAKAPVPRSPTLGIPRG